MIKRINTGDAVAAKCQVILWVDLTKSGRGTPPPRVAEQFVVYQLHNTQQIASTIGKAKPLVVCFEYDYPDNHGLAALTRIQRTHPTLPILVISTRYSDQLKLRALRARAWDYIVKPYPIADALHVVIDWTRKQAGDRSANQERYCAI